MAYAGDTKLIDNFETFFREHHLDDLNEIADSYPDHRSLYIDWKTLQNFDQAIADDLRTKPTQILEYAEEAIRLMDSPVDTPLGQVHVRVRNLPQQTGISEFSSGHRGMLVEIQGTVDKTSDVAPTLTVGAFECQRCGTLTRIPEDRGALEEPHECQGCERKGPFKINEDQSEFVDRQQLYIQEHSPGSGNQTPGGIEVVVNDDLTGTVTPGEDVRITGIAQLDQQNSGRRQERGFDFYLDGLAIESVGEKFPAIGLTQQEIETITSLSNRDDLFDQLVGSIAPTVYGYETEKLALALQLFSGVRKERQDGTESRGSIHTLFVSDPGTFAERLLESAAACSPRVFEASGSETSGTGLTSTAVASDSSSGSSPWTIEAGPLIHADEGHALLTGINDLGAEAENSLAAVLRKQSVDVSKASEVVSLPARTSVMAVGRPTMGRFDKHAPITEQIDVDPDIVGSCDLIFAIPDQPDDKEDEKRAEYTLKATYSGKVNTHPEKVDTVDDDAHLIEEMSPAIDPELLQKYIAHAQRNYSPTLTESARKTLKESYSEMRATAADEESPVPINQLQLESMIRLAEASARARLSDTVEEADTERAVEIIAYCFRELGGGSKTDEVDAEEMPTGTTKRQRDQIKNILDLIVDIEEEYDEGAPIEVVVERAAEVGVDPDKAEHEIEQLKGRGELYEPLADHLRTT